MTAEAPAATRGRPVVKAVLCLALLVTTAIGCTPKPGQDSTASPTPSAPSSPGPSETWADPGYGQHQGYHFLHGLCSQLDWAGFEQLAPLDGLPRDFYQIGAQASVLECDRQYDGDAASAERDVVGLAIALHKAGGTAEDDYRQQAEGTQWRKLEIDPAIWDEAVIHDGVEDGTRYVNLLLRDEVFVASIFIEVGEEKLADAADPAAALEQLALDLVAEARELSLV
ncbi:hypothetical protein AB0I28_04515 [Phytomonospora sp. NPDC050363]|uniref:hypothetical protein n=1 Tax=Phytomonospora sp. NPDC050363 TaxID=3155642 RepID=UPI0033D624A4